MKNNKPDLTKWCLVIDGHRHYTGTYEEMHISKLYHTQEINPLEWPDEARRYARAKFPAMTTPRVSIEVMLLHEYEGQQELIK